MKNDNSFRASSSKTEILLNKKSFAYPIFTRHVSSEDSRRSSHPEIMKKKNTVSEWETAFDLSFSWENRL